LNSIDSLKEPERFDDACCHPYFEERIKWREAISKEFDEMKEKRVYETILKLELPNNGIFCARLVTCGYIQVCGEWIFKTVLPP
jgi:hypothetical protein